MNIKHHLITVLAACCALGISSASAQNYTLTDLGVLPGKVTSVPTALNDQAQVTGISATGAVQSVFCYDYNKKIMEDVSVIPSTISRGFGINGFGQMVGDSTFSKGRTISHAALITKGSILDLGTLRNSGLNSYSRANGINALGQVVGFAGPKRDGNESRAFAWTTATGMFDLGTLGGTYAQAVAINDAGFVTGNAQLPASSVEGVEFSHAFIYQPFSPAIRRMHDLGTLGGDDSYGTFINAKNHVVGYSTVNKSDDRIHAFLHDGKKMNDLGSLSGASVKSDISFALGVNASDEVVGYSYIPSYKQPAPQQVAFIYREGLMLNLNDLVLQPGTNNYRLDSATAINDEGQIAAIAFDKATGDFRAVLLTPIVKGK
jgi:probable HAF family extracellular repeat protein